MADGEAGQILARLQRLAAGRREYANGAPAEVREALLGEADILDAAVKVAGGSKLTLLGLIPLSWWADDEERWIRVGEPDDGHRVHCPCHGTVTRIRRSIDDWGDTPAAALNVIRHRLDGGR